MLLKVRAGGGWAAILYTVWKSLRALGGPRQFWRRMFSRNTCKTCALGMGGQAGGMTNEVGQFPEFCKKSVQAMAHDMQAPLDSGFFERRPVEGLTQLSSRELENLGRLSYPVIRESGGSHFIRIGWDDALDRVARAMRGTSPSRSFFYSSGRSSNEAAFLLQWLARVYGTNNVNNCSFYCHQASGVALKGSIGSGTATVTLEDLGEADFAMVIGANPASNHPRLITQLYELRRRGGTVVVVNPLRELGLERFKIPSKPLSLLFGSRICDHYVQPRIGGDIAFLKAILKSVLASGSADRDFIEANTVGFDKMKAELDQETMTDLTANAGVDGELIDRVAGSYSRAKGAVFLWAMGITHHEHGVDNVSAITNLALARGMVGRKGAGLMPIRGHSNVQGIGSVGFDPELKRGFMDFMGQKYGLRLPTERGLDSMGSLLAARDGAIDFALFLGGNFYHSNPDSASAAEALGRIRHTVHISTKLNQGHVRVNPANDGWVLILPTCVRDEELQSTTQESLFSLVRLSDGGMPRPSRELKSEVEIITGVGARLLPRDGPIDFSILRDHEQIRNVMAQVVPGYEQVKDIGKSRKEFHASGRVRHERRFPTSDGRARFQVITTPRDELGPRELRLTTLRSEGQFNTVVYEEEDRYRNQGSRDVVLMNPEDMSALRLKANARVTVRSKSGAMSGIRVRPYAISQGSAAMYYPEANSLTSLKVDPASGTPSFKNVRVTLSLEPG